MSSSLFAHGPIDKDNVILYANAFCVVLMFWVAYRIWNSLLVRRAINLVATVAADDTRLDGPGPPTGLAGGTKPSK